MANKFSSLPISLFFGNDDLFEQRLVIHTQIVSAFRYSPVRWHIHSSGCFIPASGNRSNSAGALNYFGERGYAWSASPFSTATNGYNLRIISSDVNPDNNNNRSNGFPVRCVAAFITVFYKVSNYTGYEKKQFTGRLIPGIL